MRAGQIQVRFIVSANGPDIFPIPVKGIGKDLEPLFDRRRDDMAPKIRPRLLAQEIKHNLALKDVDAHRSHVRLVARQTFQPRQVIHRGFLHKAMNVACLICLQNAKARRLLCHHRLDRDGDVRLMLPVKSDKERVIHPVKMITGEDHHIVGVRHLELEELLAQRIRRALIPGRTCRRLLRRQDAHPPVRKVIELVSARDVAMQRDGVKLGQHIDTIDAGVNAIADRDIDQPVVPRQRDSRLGPQLRQRIKPAPCAPAQDHSKHIMHCVLHFRASYRL